MSMDMISQRITMIWITGDGHWYHDFSTQPTKTKGLTTKCQQENRRAFCVSIVRKVSALKDICRKVPGNTIFSHDHGTRKLYCH